MLKPGYTDNTCQTNIPDAFWKSIQRSEIENYDVETSKIPGIILKQAKLINLTGKAFADYFTNEPVKKIFLNQNFHDNR